MIRKTGIMEIFVMVITLSAAVSKGGLIPFTAHVQAIIARIMLKTPVNKQHQSENEIKLYFLHFRK